MRFTILLALGVLLTGCNPGPPEAKYLSLDQLKATPEFAGFEVTIKPSYRLALEDDITAIDGPYQIVENWKYDMKRADRTFEYKFKYDEKEYFVTLKDAPGYGLRVYLLKNKNGDVGTILLKTTEKVPAPSNDRGARARQRPSPAQIKERIFGNDADKDGKLVKAELPERMQGMLADYDTNGDEALDSEEVDKMLAARMSGGAGDDSGRPNRPPADDSGDSGETKGEKSNEKKSG